MWVFHPSQYASKEISLAWEFNDPAEVAFDDHGNSIFVDTKNNRLQLVDSNQNAFPVKVRMTFGYIIFFFKPIIY